MSSAVLVMKSGISKKYSENTMFGNFTVIFLKFNSYLNIYIYLKKNLLH